MSLAMYSEQVLRIKGHRFNPHILFNRQKCSSCYKYTVIGTEALSCRFCGTIIHARCKDFPLLPCSLAPESDDLYGAIGTIEAYAPSEPPFVPSLVVRCIREVELRGMEKNDLYQTEADSDEARSLLEKLLKNEKVTNLRQVDIDVIALTLKLFLSELREPLLTKKIRDDFVRLIENFAQNDKLVKLIDQSLLWKLPEANHDTLAFLMIHLQKVSNCIDCEMSKVNLAVEFGPALVGDDVNPFNQTSIAESLLNMPPDVWTRRINFEQLVMARTDPEIVSEPTHSRSLFPNENSPGSNYEEDANDEFERMF